MEPSAVFLESDDYHDSGLSDFNFEYSMQVHRVLLAAYGRFASCSDCRRILSSIDRRSRHDLNGILVIPCSRDRRAFPLYFQEKTRKGTKCEDGRRNGVSTMWRRLKDCLHR